MLQREAEQASDDQVVHATDRPEDYARGLTSVAEMASLNETLERIFSIMNIYAAAESHLSPRIRRTLAGGVRRMSTRSRVIAAVLLCGVCAVTLPSTGIAQDRDSGVDWETVRTTAPETWSDELKEQIVAAGYEVEAIAERVRLGQQEEAGRTERDADDDRLREFQEGVIAEAMVTSPEDWSDELKAAIVRAGWDPDEFAEGIRARQARQEIARKGKTDDVVDWRAAMATAPEEWSEELKAQIVAAGYDLEEVVEKIGMRKQGIAREGKTDDVVDWRAAMATAPEEWSEELKAQIVAAGYDLEEVAEKIGMRQQAEREARSELEEIGLELRAAVGRGEITAEDARARYEAALQRLGQGHDEGATDPEAGDDTDDARFREYQHGVAARAMATPPEDWSDELKVAIRRAGWDPDVVAERVRQAQKSDSESLDLTGFGVETNTAVRETSWGQVKKGVGR